MPANKSNVSTPRKEKSDGKLYTLATSAAAAASRKKKRSLPFVKHKHYAQYLVSVSDELKRKTKQKKEKERKIHCDTNRAAMYEKGRASRPFVRRRRSMELRSIVPRITAARSTLLEYVVFRGVTSPPLQDMGGKDANPLTKG